MDYIEVTCRFAFSREKADILISALAAIGCDGFIEEKDYLQAYFPERGFDPAILDAPGFEDQLPFKVRFTVNTIRGENWNQVWESSYPAVIIGDQCIIRAPFHSPQEGIRYDIVIEPKMSFGTAHHETTAMMIEYLLTLEVLNKSVLDMGCGTGVLAILASRMGASTVVAIDNDEWAYANTLENIRKNNIPHCSVYLTDASSIEANTFDLILANINRNILLQDMARYAEGLHVDGSLVVSGFYQDDVAKIIHGAMHCGLEVTGRRFKGEWAALGFLKPEKRSKTDIS